MRRSGTRRRSSSNITVISRRARLAPRQKCGPPAPKPTCAGVIGRVMSNRYGSGNIRSSRLAELYQRTTFWPAAMRWPDSSVSSVAVRRKWITGVAQRTISSTAVRVWASKSPYQRSRWSGCSVSAFMPWLMALRVVSLPATTSRMKNEPNSCWEAVAVDLGGHR